MSRPSSVELQCPDCGNSQEITVWDSVNVTLDPDLKRQLYAAGINVFACEQCGMNSWANAPLLYHDMTQRFCVQFYPPEVLDDARFFGQFNPDGSMTMTGIPAAIVAMTPYLANPHVVFDMKELIRYVTFRDGTAGAADRPAEV
jgi:predicted RNA-binding Zn-ribbon protein involved in translation (DUF1610 family)